MNYTLDFLLLKEPVQLLPLPQINLIKLRLGVYGGLETGDEIVRHHDLPARVDQLIDGVGTDIARAAQH